MKEREKKGKLGREILSLQQRSKVCRRPIRSSGGKNQSSEEFSIWWEQAYLSIPDLLSHWLEAICGKCGFGINAVTDSEHSSWDCQSSMFPTAEALSGSFLSPLHHIFYM